MSEADRLRIELAETREKNVKLLLLIDELQKQVNIARVGRKPVVTKTKLSHGISRYTQGCRCEICKTAASDYQRIYREKHRQSF